MPLPQYYEYGREKDRSAMLAVPHQDGIVHQAELVCLSIKGIGNLPVVSDFLKEPLIAIVGQVIVVTAKQNLLALQLGNQRE